MCLAPCLAVTAGGTTRHPASQMRLSQPLLKRHPQPSPTLSEASSLSFGSRLRLNSPRSATGSVQCSASNTPTPRTPGTPPAAVDAKLPEWTATPPANVHVPIVSPGNSPSKTAAVETFPCTLPQESSTAQASRVAKRECTDSRREEAKRRIKAAVCTRVEAHYAGGGTSETWDGPAIYKAALTEVAEHARSQGWTPQDIMGGEEERG